MVPFLQMEAVSSWMSAMSFSRTITAERLFGLMEKGEPFPLAVAFRVSRCLKTTSNSLVVDLNHAMHQETVVVLT